MQSETREFSVEAVSETSQEEMVRFLKKHEDFSIFLLDNYEAHGYTQSKEPNSGNYKLIKRGEELLGAFSLTNQGNLLVVAEAIEPLLFEAILRSTLQETTSIKGLIGDWNFCYPFWEYLKENKVIRKDIFVSKEILYSITLDHMKIYEQPKVRFLRPSEYKSWRDLRGSYIKEMGIPNDLDEKQIRHQFLKKAHEKIIWGLFEEKKLVSAAELNAKAFQIGQAGGVYTSAEMRRKGLSKSVMLQLLRDIKIIHGLHKLILFTGDHNLPARRLYESIGMHPIGYFALMFGESYEPHS